MLKKAIGLFAVAMAVAALTVLPLAASADYVPSPGHSCKTALQKKTYCKRACVVPSVVGKSLKRAKESIRKHDCSVGRIKRSERDKDTKGQKQREKKEKGERPVVKRQSPDPNTIWKFHKNVNLVVRG